MRRREQNVAKRPFYNSFVAYRIMPSTSSNVQPALITIALGLGLLVRIVVMARHHSQRLAGVHMQFGATPHRAGSCITQQWPTHSATLYAS